MFNKILVPVDFSPKSHYSLAVASEIVKRSGGEIDLFHVVQAALSVRVNELGEYESLGKSGQQFLEDILKTNEARLEKLAGEYVSDTCKINLRLKVDDLPDKVAEHIHEEAYDLLIVGGDTDYKLDEAFGENHNEKIVKLAKRPVLVVNKQIENVEVKKIIVPTNLVDDYGECADMLKKTQRFFDAEIIFLHINTPSYFHTTYELDRIIKDFQERYSFDNCRYEIISDKSRKKGILTAAEYFKADMVGLLSFQSKSMMKFFRGDISEYLVNHSEIPVMVFNVER